MGYINNSRHLARKYARIFVRGHYLFREANSFPRAKLEKNCELRGTYNVRGQISEHIFAPNGDYCFRSIRFSSRNFQNFRLNGSLLEISTISRFSGNFLRKFQYHDFGNLGRMESAQGQPCEVIKIFGNFLQE